VRSALNSCRLFTRPIRKIAAFGQTSCSLPRSQEPNLGKILSLSILTNFSLPISPTSIRVLTSSLRMNPPFRLTHKNCISKSHFLHACYTFSSLIPFARLPDNIKCRVKIANIFITQSVIISSFSSLLMSTYSPLYFPIVTTETRLFIHVNSNWQVQFQCCAFQH
jgi:hypothetical protein